MSEVSNREAFYQVHPAIRRYLSLKEQNWLKVPTGIFRHEDLVQQMENFMQDKKRKFFNVDAPILFISSPTNSITNAEYEENRKIIFRIIQQVAAALPWLEIRFPAESKKLWLDDVTFKKNLETIKRTHYYVLLHNGSNKVSSAILEMAYALIYCKTTMLFYVEDSLPRMTPMLQRQPAFNYLLCEKIESLPMEEESIAVRIIATIKQQWIDEFGPFPPTMDAP